MRSWHESERALDAPRVDLHCLVCGKLDRAYLDDVAQDGDDDYRCLTCVREAQARRRLLQAIATGGSHAA